MSLPLEDNLIARYDATDPNGVSGGTQMTDLSGNGYHFTIASDAYIEGATNADNYFDFEGSYDIAKYVVDNSLTNMPIGSNATNDVTIIVFTKILDTTFSLKALCRHYSTIDYLYQNIQILIDSGVYGYSNNIGMVDRYPSNIFYSSNFNITGVPAYTRGFNMYVFKLSTRSPYFQFRYNLNRTYSNITNSGAIFNEGFASIGGDHNRIVSNTGSQYFWGKIKRFLYYDGHLNDNQIDQIYNIYTENNSAMPLRNVRLSDVRNTYGVRTNLRENGLVCDTTGTVSGTGNYFADDLTLFNILSLTRTVTDVIDEPLRSDSISWSTRWSGYFKPTVSGTYKFKTRSADSSLVYIGSTDMPIDHFNKILQIGDYDNSNALPYLYVDNNGSHVPQDIESVATDFITGFSYPISIYYGNLGNVSLSQMVFQHSRVSGDNSYDYTTDLSDGQFITNFDPNKMSSYYNLTTPITTINNGGLSMSTFRNSDYYTPAISITSTITDVNLSCSSSGLISGAIDAENSGIISINLDNNLINAYDHQKPIIYSVTSGTVPSQFYLTDNIFGTAGTTSAISDSTGVQILGTNYLGHSNIFTFTFNIFLNF